MSATATAMKAKKGAPAAGGAAKPVVPFVRASHEVTEGPFLDVTIQPGSGSKAIQPVPTPARGFASSIVLLLETAVAGDLDGGATTEDFPWNILQNVAWGDPNGITYYGPTSGYGLFEANKWGGFQFFGDPEAEPDYSPGGAADLAGNATFLIRVPIVITPRDGFGSLLNENAAAAYKLAFDIASTSVLFTGLGGGAVIPTYRIRAWLEAQADPTPQDRAGNPQQQQPPGFGNVQYFTEQVFDVVAGNNTIRFTRVGNLFRVIGMTYRDSDGLRSTVDFPELVNITWDSRQLYTGLHKRHIRSLMHERYGSTPDTGVFVLDYIHDLAGHAGDEARNLYLPTKTSTRFELQGVFGDSGTLTILTNDIGKAGNPFTPQV